MRRAAVLILSAATVVLASLALFVPSVFSSLLRGTRIWPNGDRYTALYFTHPNALVTRAPTTGILPVSFTIENHELGWRRYTYEVSVGRGGRDRRVAATGELSVAPARSTEQTVDLPDFPPGRRLVQVRLVGSASAISYWTS